LSNTSWLEVVPDESIPSTVQAWDLGAGESAVIAHALAHPGVEAILDDLAARRCAAALDIPVRGTLGIVLVAKKRRLINSARDTLDELVRSGMYLSERLILASLKSVGE
jgi:predicted nucleic acid-binding protein